MKLKLPELHFALLALAAPSVAFATLGADVSSVQIDRMAMKASMPASNTSANYTVHEMSTASGVTVREYANSIGTVFAVAWRGPAMPNLRQLLGSYFDNYTGAAKSQHLGHSHLSVRQDNLVVRASGHMRAFSGSAYDPKLLPQGVTEDQIK